MDTDQPSRILQKQSQAGLVSTDWSIVYKQIPGQLFCDLLYLKMYFDSYLSTLFLRNKINLVCSVSIFYVCGSGQFLLFLVVHLVGFSQTAWNEFLSDKSHVQRGTGDNGSGHKHLVSSCSVLPGQCFQPHIFHFAQLSLTLLRISFEQCEEWILVISSSHVAIVFIVDVLNFSLDWWNNIQLSCLALACWWMRISNDPIARQDKPPPTLPSLHLLHVPSTSLSPCLSISPLIASWWAGVW